MPFQETEPIEDTGWGLVVYHNDADGIWRVARDAWGSDRPAKQGQPMPMTRRVLRALLATVAGAAAVVTLQAAAGQPQAPAPERAPRPVRNEVPRTGRELVVLRNHQLRTGGHEPFFQFSRDGLWPYFDRIGARVVGQWKVLDPPSGAADREDVYRLTRYASFQHWLGTRSGNQTPIAGDGPAWAKGQAGMSDRTNLELGSAGAYFLDGQMAPSGPIFMPPTAEQYRLTGSAERPPLDAAVIAVRAGVAQPGQEIVELRYQRIRNGSFEQFTEATTSAIWPWEQKLGARPIGQWRVVYPRDPGDGSTLNAQGRSALQFITTFNPDYEEVVTLTRYGSRAHREALATPARAVYEGGNGPDFVAWQAALEKQKGLVLSTRTETMQGFMYDSPPLYLPALPERYDRVP